MIMVVGRDSVRGRSELHLYGSLGHHPVAFLQSAEDVLRKAEHHAQHRAAHQGAEGSGQKAPGDLGAAEQMTQAVNVLINLAILHQKL